MTNNQRTYRRSRSPFTALSLCAPASLIEALEWLAIATGNGRTDDEWLRAVNEHLIRMYRLVKSHPEEPLFPDPTGQAIPSFLDAVEHYLRQSRQWPLPDML